jgi:hypothetical protein
MKVVAKSDRTHNPFGEIYWVSRLRENLTSGSDGKGLETGLRSTLNGHARGNPGYSQGYSYGLPRQSFTRQEAFLIVKRVLNLSYLWTGSENGVLLQVWSTWLFFAVLVDLGDAVAEELRIEFDRISLEMLIRGLYHFSLAYQKGLADYPVKYFAAPENRDLGVVNRIRKKRPSAADPPPPNEDLTTLGFA